MPTLLGVLILVLSLVVLAMLGVLIRMQRRERSGLYLLNPDAVIRVLSTSHSMRILRPLSLLEVLFRRRVYLPISENELLIVKANRAATVSLSYRGAVTEPDLILQAEGAGQRRVKVGERCDWLLSPDHDLVIRTVAAYEPDTGTALKTFA
jgi:hypothetical protein